MLKNSILVFAATLAYSILRYNVFGDIPFNEIPVFIINKAVAFSVVVFLFFLLDKSSPLFNDYLNLFKKLAVIHVLLSILLLSLNYFPKFINNDKLSLLGGGSVLAGVLAFVANTNFSKSASACLMLCLFLAIHVFLIGFKSWLNISSWPGSMPPITLWCFILVIVFSLYKMIYPQKSSSPK